MKLNGIFSIPWRQPLKLQGAALVAAIVSAGLSGCQLAEETAKLPMRAVNVAVPTSKPGAGDPALVQAQLQRFADDYAHRTVAALDDYAQHLGTEAARRQALQWKVGASAAAVSIATAPNPQAGILDFLALTSITRMGLEEDWLKTTDGAAFQPWLDASRKLEANAWKLANEFLTPKQQQEMRDAILDFWKSNPAAHSVQFMRPQDFSSLIRKTREPEAGAESVFGLLGLDPTAGLDPAVREVTRTRLFAERAMFMAQRMPFLLRWQVELMTDQLLRDASVARVLDSAERISRATETVSQAVAQLPDQLTAERKAILASLETQAGKLHELAAEITRTLTAGGDMSTSLNTTLKTFDGLMERFGVGQTNAAPAASDPNARPFDILDYARTAEQVAAMSRELNAVLKELNTTLDSPALEARLAAVNQLSDHAAASLRSLVYQVFVLAVVLVVFTFGCLWTYRAYHRNQGIDSNLKPK